MAINSSPAFQHYPRDEIANPDIAALSPEEFGIYRMLINYIWLKGFLEYEERNLAKILKISPKKFRKVFSAIEKFFKIEDGKVTCPELDEQRLKQAEWRLKSSEGGKETVRRRREKVKGGSEMVQRVVQPDVNSSTSTSTSTSKKHTPLLSQIENLDDNGSETEKRVSVKNGSKFSEDERRKYIQSQNWSINPEGWLVKSESGCFDKQIAKWFKNPRPVVGVNGAGKIEPCKWCKKHNDYPDDVKPCPSHQKQQFEDWKKRRDEVTAANGSSPLFAAGST